MKRLILVALVFSGVACGNGKQPPPPPACDQTCMDGVAILALRDAMKLEYNATLQGQDAGSYDAATIPACGVLPKGTKNGTPCPCPLGGTALVFGTATVNAEQGAAIVQLTYVFDHCGYSSSPTSTDPNTVYKMMVNGTVTEDGTIASQPTANTALDIKGDAVTFSGTVYSPPINYEADNCALALGQNGNDLSGTLCGRDTGTTL
jgi:hypothetical protein